MEITEKLEAGEFYHIYNHGVGERDLFREPDNYDYFLGLYDKYISPVADTYAWVLMPNHFHLLVRIKENVVYKYNNADRFMEEKWQTIDLSNLTASEGPVSVEEKVSIEGPGSVEGMDNIDKNFCPEEHKIPKPHLHFSHLFNAYSKYYNKRYETRGALFERPFKRILIDSKGYLKQAFIYIHNNPVYHEFCSHPGEYPWSSYHTCISTKTTKLKRDEVLGWFDNITDFTEEHEKEIERDKMERWG
jgi:putative transposase